MKKLWFAVALVTILALLIGCSPSTPPPTPSPTAPKPAPSPSPTAVASPTSTPKPSPTVAAVKTGGILKFPLIIVPAGYDAHRKLTFSPFPSVPIFNNLVEFDPSQAGIPQIIPDLADKWDISSDGKTFTFYLHKGVTWHDGIAFNADDVVYSLQKMMDPKRSSVTDYFKVVDRVEKVDDLTVKLYLKTQSPSILLQLASGYAPIQSQHLASVDYKSDAFLVGTGPFKLGKVTSGVSLELVRNPNYWKKDAAGRQLPYLDGVTMYIMADRQAQLDALTTQRLDMTAPLGGVVNQQILDQVKQKMPTFVMETMHLPYGTVNYFNQKSGPTTDVRVRHALGLLMDPKAGILAAYGSDSWGNYGHAFFSPTWGLPSSEVYKLTEYDQPLEQRAVKAKQLMTDAGYANGFKMKYPVSTTPEAQRLAQVYVDYFRKYLNVQADTPISQVADLVAMRDSGDFGMIYFDTLAMLGLPDELMVYFRTGASANFSGYSNPTTDKLWDQQAITMDPAQRKVITQQIESSLLTDWAGVPNPTLNWITGYWPYVKGFVVNDITYSQNTRWETVWLDK